MKRQKVEWKGQVDHTPVKQTLGTDNRRLEQKPSDVLSMMELDVPSTTELDVLKKELDDPLMKAQHGFVMYDEWTV